MFFGIFSVVLIVTGTPSLLAVHPAKGLRIISTRYRSTFLKLVRQHYAFGISGAVISSKKLMFTGG